MRRLILIAGIAIGVGACGRGGQESVDQNAGDNLTAESIVSNDVTAIDAATGDAANMAADVDMNYGNLAENAGGPVSNAPSPRKPAPGKPPLEAPMPTPTEAVTNNAT
jgi:hypothetical protein